MTFRNRKLLDIAHTAPCFARFPHQCTQHLGCDPAHSDMQLFGRGHGHRAPDWAIAFHEGKVKHIYFVAETKGDLSSMQLRKVEELKVHCAREHFKRISSDTVKYEVVDGYDALLNVVMK